MACSCRSANRPARSPAPSISLWSWLTPRRDVRPRGLGTAWLPSAAGPRRARHARCLGARRVQADRRRQPRGACGSRLAGGDRRVCHRSDSVAYIEGARRSSPGSLRDAWGRGSVASALRREAVGAVDGLQATGAEGNLRLAAALRARRGEHLARSSLVAAARVAGTVAGRSTRCLADRTAGRAATRLAELAIGVDFELLLGRGERERLAAVDAGERLVSLGGEHEKTPSRAAPANLVSPRTVERSDRAAALSAPTRRRPSSLPEKPTRVERLEAARRDVG